MGQAKMTDRDEERSTEEATPTDRNWNELLQELRVTQTGLQILTAFLVTLPFQQRFSALTAGQVRIYLGVLATAVLATVLVLAPVNFHRMLFRQQEKQWLVLVGNRCARAGLLLSGLAVIGVVWLIFDFVVGGSAGPLAAGTGAVVFIGVWLAFPLLRRRRAVTAPTPDRSPRERRQA
jgi:high-affinity Fe2+/Pb2+ permease